LAPPRLIGVAEPDAKSIELNGRETLAPTARRHPAQARKSHSIVSEETTMLALLGLITVIVLLAAIITKRMSPLIALILIPVLASLAGGFGLDTSKFIVEGFSPLTPATFLIVGLTGIDLGDHQKFAIPFLFGASVVMTIACVLFGVFPL